MLVITPLPAMRMKCDEEKMTAIDDLKTVLKDQFQRHIHKAKDKKSLKMTLKNLHAELSN